MSEIFSQIKEFLTAHKKMLYTLIVVAVLVAALAGILERKYVVEGVVSAVSVNKVTVTDFWGSKTVSLNQSWLKQSPIAIGDRVEITKNLQGQIIDVETHDSKEHGRSSESDHDFERGHGH